MKAILKATCEVVELEFDPNIDRWLDITSDEPRTVYKSCDIDEYFSFHEPLTTSFDWDAFRNETAAKLMQSYVLSTMSNEKTANAFIKMDKTNNPSKLMAEMAIQQTDELIKQLKAD